MSSARTTLEDPPAPETFELNSVFASSRTATLLVQDSRLDSASAEVELGLTRLAKTEWDSCNNGSEISVPVLADTAKSMRNRADGRSTAAGSVRDSDGTGDLNASLSCAKRSPIRSSSMSGMSAFRERKDTSSVARS